MTSSVLGSSVKSSAGAHGIQSGLRFLSLIVGGVGLLVTALLVLPGRASSRPTRSAAENVRSTAFEPDNLLPSAVGLLGATINQPLREAATAFPQLRWDIDNDRFFFTTEYLRPNLCLGLVLQLAEAVMEDKQFQRCPVCGTWFLLQPGVNKADRITCSGACRKKAWRLRKERAVSLAGEGKTPREIAEEVGSDIKTVKGWLAETKEQ
jgi:hypothetical protein